MPGKRKFIRPSHAIFTAGLKGAWVERDDVERAPACKGAYLLLLQLNKPLAVHVRSIGTANLAAGWYVYAGSAWGSGGLRARIARHLRQNKKPHWHIDPLTIAANDLSALALPDTRECDLIARLIASGSFSPAISGFGSTDCRVCESHLLAFAAS